MALFNLKESSEYYLALSEKPKRFDCDPSTNVFFDDTNGQVFTVRSGGVTGVTVNGMDDSKCTSFRMEDRGSINSIKFSPDHSILAIQRSNDSQNATVEFVNFKDLAPTNVEYSHTCKWKNAKMLGFVWPKVNEIAFITDHGIELLQVVPDKKQLKSLKSISFSGAWFSWCAASNVLVLAGNNGALLQPFLLNNSTLTKLHKLELERPVVERDVFVVSACGAAWCCVFRHSHLAANTSPTEVWLMPISGSSTTHILRTSHSGRFAVSVVDDLIVIHHQSSQTSQIFDIMEDTVVENNIAIHLPAVPPLSIQPAMVDDVDCTMYSDSWVMFQPHYIIDARLGCLWTLTLLPAGLAHNVPKDSLHKIMSILLRRSKAKSVVYSLLNQLVADAGIYLAELSKVFDEVNAVYRRWAEQEMARNVAGSPQPVERVPINAKVIVTQQDMCDRVINLHLEHKYIVQVVTAYMASLGRRALLTSAHTSQAAVRALLGAGAAGRLRALLRRGAAHDARHTACQLLAAARGPPALQLALDMLRRTEAHAELVEVLLSWQQPVSALGYARQAGVWGSLAPRKLLAAAQHEPAAFVAVYHALQARNDRTRGSSAFTKGEQCDSYVELYKKLMSEQQ